MATSTSATTTTATAETTTTSTTTTTTTLGPQPAFEDGTHLVNNDVPPGTYETGSIDPFGCYWERLSGLGGTLDEIIANENADSHAIVEIAENDEAFSSTGCGEWYELEGLEELMAEIPPGTWAVGSHVAPGRYRTEASSGCYWERIAGFSGELGDIIANDNVGAGSAIVDILDGDVGFSSTGCGTWSSAS